MLGGKAVREKLLQAAGALAPSTNGRGGNDKGKAKHKDGIRKASSLTEDEVVQRWRSKPQSNGSENLRKKFIIRLATALHSYGSSASRTEYLVEKAAGRLDVDVCIAVFPALILLSFDNDSRDRQSEVHLLTVESDLDVDKLGRADELANNAGHEDTPLLLAYWRLKAIVKSPPEFGRIWWRLMGFGLAAGTASVLFFGGSLWDGFFSIILGVIVGILDFVGCKSSLFQNVIEFIAALSVSFLGKLFSLYFGFAKLCYFSMALSSLVQLLPGLSLSLGVSDMVAKAAVTGSSRIMNALFSALQLGFGLAVGENLVFWRPAPPESKCSPPNLAWWWNGLWFIGYVTSSNVLLNARLDQWPGMTLAAFVGYLSSTLAGVWLNSSSSTVVAAFAVGVTGTSYSYFTGDLPLVMVLSGILLLVPGGIGVQGVAALLKEDVLSGMGFVFDMVVVALSITVGLLLSKICFPSSLLSNGKHPATNKATIVQQFGSDSSSSSSDEEDMAI